MSSSLIQNYASPCHLCQDHTSIESPNFKGPIGSKRDESRRTDEPEEPFDCWGVSCSEEQDLAE